MWKVLFPRKLFAELREFLFSTAPRENGCFLTANYSKSGNTLLVTGFMKPDGESWNTMGEHALEPTSSYTNDCVVAADFNNASLIFVHTHPNSGHPSRFSPIDEDSNNRIFANLSQILTDRPLGSLVFSRNGIYGVVHHRGNLQPVSSYISSGTILSEIPSVSSGRKVAEVDSSFDRQVRAIGKAGQMRLQNLKVAIVGVGGTGSAVAVQLARMGVGGLTLIDKDHLDESNIPRVYGSERKDKRKPKVEVLKNHIGNLSRTEVTALKEDITDTDPKNRFFKKLLNSDVIFGCTDNLSSRSVLNDIALQYYIPLIDVGCRIDLNSDQSIRQAVAKVQVVSTDSACLWCTGVLDGRLIMQESLTDEEKRKLAEEGYYQGVERQPSIVSLTTLAASIGVNKLLSLIGIYGENTCTRTQIELKDGFMIEESPEIKSDCVCMKRRGKGDSRKIV